MYSRMALIRGLKININIVVILMLEKIEWFKIVYDYTKLTRVMYWKRNFYELSEPIKL